VVWLDDVDPGMALDENQPACPSNLAAEDECHVKIHKPAKALLGAEGQGPMKIKEPAQAL
jgi:hypothetical protein